VSGPPPSKLGDDGGDRAEQLAGVVAPAVGVA
jgi:hypothetical protein